MLGETISHYRILEKLGQGGMGEVYLAEDTRLGRKVALKFLAADLARDRESLARFRNEARAAAELSHPNIATIHDFDEVNEKSFLVLEYLEGQTLRDRTAQGPLPIEDVLSIGKALAAGLAEAHSHGIVHRDIKSANVMLTEKGEVKILDFGLARREEATQLTRPGMVLGTISYMSPEQVQGQPIDERSDLWSVGVVLYECLTGSVPFIGEGAAVFEQIKSAEVKAPTSVRTGVPVELERTILRCLERDPALRFQHADDLLASMRAYESHRHSVPVVSDRSRPKQRLIPWVLGFVAIFALVLIWQQPWVAKPDRASPGGSTFSTPRVTPLVSTDAPESSPAWSPAGNLITYAAMADGVWDVWLCDLDGSNPLNLTKSPDSVDDYPTWSPDGQTIAFYSNRDGPGIYTMTVTGGNVRRVRSVDNRLPSNALFAIQWIEPDRMIYSDTSAKGRPDMYELRLSSGEVKCLTSSSPEGVHRGRMNDGANLLSYRRPWLGVDAEFFVLNLETQEVHLLPLSGRDAQWAPGSETLLVISTADGTWDLWSQGIDPRSGMPIGQPRRLTTALAFTDLSLSPDGRHAVGTQTRMTSNVWSLPAGGAPQLDIERGSRLTNDSFSHKWAAWLPDGSGFIDVSDRRGVMNAWFTDLATGNQTRVREERVFGVISSPDSRWLIATVVEEDGTGFPYLMRRDGSDFRELDPSLRERFVFVDVSGWSRDGQRVAFHTKLDDDWRIGVMDVDLKTGTVRGVHLLPMYSAIPFFSPDGFHLVYQGSEGGRPDLFVTNLTGSEVHRLTDSDVKEWICGWEAEPSAIYFKDGETNEVYRVPMDAASRPLSEPQLWFSGSGSIMVRQWLDFHDGRAIGPMTKPQSDLYLIEFEQVQE